MRDDNNKTKLLTIGIALLLIIIISGISLVVHQIGKKENRDTDNKLQTDIIDYANSTQNQNIQNEETDETEEIEESIPDNNEEADKEDDGLPVVVEQEIEAPEKSIVEEEREISSKTEQAKKERWQTDASEDLSAVEIDLSRQMSEMKGYWEIGNMKAVEDLAYLPRYRAASKQLAGTVKYYYYGDTDQNNRPNGKGLAMYTDNQYYYGEWKDGVRSGGGMWIKYYVYDPKAEAKDCLYLQHSYSGTWGNDLPNGDGAEHYDFIEENMEKNVSYNRNFVGTFKDGLYHGDIYITDYYKDGNAKEWSGTAQNGVWQPMGDKDKKGRYPVIVELKNPDSYQWMDGKKNVNQGVDGLISAAKKAP